MNIVTNENPILRAEAHAITKDLFGTPVLMRVIEHMRTLLAKERFGVAIAAPQIGESLQLFLVSGGTLARIKKVSSHEDMVCINPRILKASKKQVLSNEGCLSVPGKYGTKVSRSEKIRMHYLDIHGHEQTYNASGFLAQIFQHEIDHLKGVLYIDHALEVIDVDENMEPLHVADSDSILNARASR